METVPENLPVTPGGSMDSDVSQLTWLYINLAHRPDRNKHLLAELARLKIPPSRIVRIEAVAHKNGELGCCLSHLKALRYISDHNLEQAVILEDDFTWKHSTVTTLETVQKILADQNWQVCLLAANGKYQPIPTRSVAQIQFNTDDACPVPGYPDLSIVPDQTDGCQTASGYLIRSSYVERLSDHWNHQALYGNMGQQRIENRQPRLTDCIDQYWKILQYLDSDSWVVAQPVLGYQYSNYSDIEGKPVNYGR